MDLNKNWIHVRNILISIDQDKKKSAHLKWTDITFAFEKKKSKLQGKKKRKEKASHVWHKVL
jgi:hypothetical protein